MLKYFGDSNKRLGFEVKKKKNRIHIQFFLVLLCDLRHSTEPEPRFHHLQNKGGSTHGFVVRLKSWYNVGTKCLITGRYFYHEVSVFEVYISCSTVFYLICDKNGSHLLNTCCVPEVSTT